MAHRDALKDLLKWINLTRLTLFGMRVSLVKKVFETTLALVSWHSPYSLAQHKHKCGSPLAQCDKSSSFASQMVVLQPWGCIHGLSAT